jgi:ADP-heptose:LPS heptosyltransferase
METPTLCGVLRLEADRPVRVAVLRALQLGDLLCAVPAFRALRRALPQAHVALVGLPWARDFVDRFNAHLDEFIEFPGYPGLPERAPAIHAIPGFLAAMQQRRFDLAIQMQGDGTITNALVSMFAARLQAGFTLSGGARRDGAHLVPYPSWLPEVRRHLYLAASLGAPSADERLEFPIRQEEAAECDAVLRRAGLDGANYGCVHAGARDPARRWPVAAFAEVADALAARGLHVVLTGDGDEERARTQAIAHAARTPVVDLAGRTSLGALAEVVRRARLVVCNDTGVSHVAAAVQTPSVIVFRTTDPARWAPLDRRLHRVVRDGAFAVRTTVSEIDRLLAEEDVRVA